MAEHGGSRDEDRDQQQCTRQARHLAKAAQSPTDETQPLRYRGRDRNAAAAIMTTVAAALAGQQWARSKSCPDCRNVFYDHSRNRSRTWCSVYAETPDGRACGSISKVRAYRKRQRGDWSPD
ncbi:CGNR zinc finger domain-containing protein [Nocardia niwae]|nr:CGNR zinc finger domain-containing protein [Nocardia niwae]